MLTRVAEGEEFEDLATRRSVSIEKSQVLD
jgi:hypothetical protein